VGTGPELMEEEAGVKLGDIGLNSAPGDMGLGPSDLGEYEGDIGEYDGDAGE